MEQFLIDMVAQFPWLAGLFLVMGIFRAIFKPTMLVVEAYVTATPTKTDDEKFASFKSGKIYKALAWVVDYLASVKLPAAKKPEQLPAGKANDNLQAS